MVLERSDSTRIRTRALRAYAKSVNNDWPILDSLDSELAQAADDSAASEVRADLLQLTRSFGVFPTRMLSILEQAAKSKKQGPTGRFYSLNGSAIRYRLRHGSRWCFLCADWYGR